MTEATRSIVRYVGVTYLLSYALQLWIAWKGGIEGPTFGWLAPIVMYVPGMVALLLAKNRRSSIPWRVPGPGYVLAGAILPALTAVACSLAIHAAGIGTSTRLRMRDSSVVPNHRIFVLGSGEQSLAYFLINLLVSALAFSAVAGLLAFGEELGWRGYLQQKVVQRFGVARGIGVLGVVWAYWHLPLVLMGYNYPETPVLGALVLLPLVGVGLSFFLAGLTLPSRSLWPAVIGHGSVNAFYGALVYGIDFRQPRLWADALVILTAGLLGGVGWYLLQRRGPVPAE